MSGMRAFRLVLAVIIAFPVLRAVPAYSWHGSGNISALAIDPQNPAIIYAGTTDRGVFKSTNGGDNWSATGLTNISVGALAIDPQNSSTLYAGTSAGVYKSMDGGTNWSATGPLEGPVFVLAIDSQTPSTLYAGTSVGVFKSTNGGENWSATGLTTSPPNSSLQALAVARQNPTILYAGVGYVAYAWDEVQWSEVVKSTDGGASWSSTTLGAGYLDWVRIQAVVIGPQDPAIVYAGTDTDWAGVSKSLDGGTTWGGSDSGAVRTLAIDPRTPTTVYAGTDDRGILKSVDGGGTWSPVNTGLTNYIHALGLPVGIRVLAIDPLTPTTVYAGTAAGVFKSMDGGAFWSPTSLIQHSPLVSLSFSPTIVTGGTASTGTVILNAAAPVGGAVITLGSSNTAVATVPTGVTVAAGATSANFTVSTSPVTASTTLSISAAFDDAVRSAALTVGPALAYLGLNPNGIAGGIASIGLVVLGAPAPIDGAVVTLSSSNPAVATVPTSVTVAAGATSANFTVSTSAVTTPTMVTISGAYGGDTKSALLNVVPTTLSSLSLSSTSVPAGSTSTGTVTLSVPAPVGGAVVTLSSGNTAVATVPASVTVAAGATSANFTVSTNSVLPPTYSAIAVTILAANGGVGRSVNLIVTLPPAATLSSVSLDPNSVTGESTSAGTVMLSAPAPSGGAVVPLSSSNTAVATVPASVTVAAGTTSANFTVSTSSASACTSAVVTISGAYGGATRSADLTVAPAAKDTITIQQTDYFASRQELRVAAKSSNSSATLRVYVTSTGELIGALTKGGDGTYRGQFKWPGNPMSITVQSSLCGSATSAVRSK